MYTQRIKYFINEVVAPVLIGAAMGVCAALALFYNL
jgi:hypothetical protein